MTHTILQIDSSLFGRQGNSATLTAYALEHLETQSQQTLSVIHRNVTTDELPHFSAQTLEAISQGKATLADQLIEEIQAADTVIIGAPMYNFGLPSQLKAWFDHIARAGVTFKYTDKGPVGLLQGKTALVVHSYGGKHAGTQRDTSVAYIDTMLGFIGISDVTHVIAEGLAMSDGKDAALAQAKADIDSYINTQQLELSA